MSGFIRSVRCTVVNSSTYALVRKSDPEKEHKWGSYDEPTPPARIEPGGTAMWNTSTAGVFTGTEGEVQFSVEKTSGGVYRVWWNNPFAGDNTFDDACTGVSDWRKVERTAQDPDSGDKLDEEKIKSDDDVHVTFTFTNIEATATEAGKGDDAQIHPPVVQNAGGLTGEVSLPAGAKRVLLIPQSANDGVQRDNIKWAAQWQKKDPTTRITKVVPNKTSKGDIAAFKTHMERFATLVETAAKEAGRGGEIILFTGHGTLGGDHAGDGDSAFDTTPETDASANDKWVTQKITEPQIMKIRGGTTGERLDAIKAAIKKMREAMNGAGVRRFTILACDVGKDFDFMGSLASPEVMNVEIRAYKRIVLSALGKHGKIQLWVPSTQPPGGLTVESLRNWALEHAPPPNGDDADAASYHEPPLTQLYVVNPAGKALSV